MSCFARLASFAAGFSRHPSPLISMGGYRLVSTRPIQRWPFLLVLLLSLISLLLVLFPLFWRRTTDPCHPSSTAPNRGLDRPPSRPRSASPGRRISLHDALCRKDVPISFRLHNPAVHSSIVSKSISLTYVITSSSTFKTERAGMIQITARGEGHQHSLYPGVLVPPQLAWRLVTPCMRLSTVCVCV